MLAKHATSYVCELFPALNIPVICTLFKKNKTNYATQLIFVLINKYLESF